jgi:hypothetical protein
MRWFNAGLYGLFHLFGFTDCSTISAKEFLREGVQA